jgi:hypothetical protein
MDAVIKWNNLAPDRDEGRSLVNTTVKHCFMLVSYLAYSYTLTLKIEATCSSETSVDFQRTTRCYILGDRTLHNNCCKNVKFYVLGRIYRDRTHFMSRCKLCIAVGYVLDGRDSIPGRDKTVSLLHSLQSGCGAHPASYRILISL